MTLYLVMNKRKFLQTVEILTDLLGKQVTTESFFLKS